MATTYWRYAVLWTERLNVLAPEKVRRISSAPRIAFAATSKPKTHFWAALNTALRRRGNGDWRNYVRFERRFKHHPERLCRRNPVGDRGRAYGNGPALSNAHGSGANECGANDRAGP